MPTEHQEAHRRRGAHPPQDAGSRTETELRRGARRPTAAEAARVLSSVLLPNLARGVIVRRPLMTGLVAGLDADRRAVSLLRGLRERHGDDPLPLRLAGRRLALVLSPEDVGRLLRETPEPFSPGGMEKRGALSHFQPHGVLISDHDARPGRRAANVAALVPGQTIHPDGDVVAGQADDEALALRLALRSGEVLDWRRFADSFHAMARRVVFGSFAAQDRRTTELLHTLRSRANWAYAAPADHAAREEFLGRVRANIERAEPGSLAARLVAGSAAAKSAAGCPHGGDGQGADVHPEDQVAHWLFAFDAAAVAAFRSLALLTSLSPGAHAAREEADGREGLDLPLLRATVRESVRLWPTTLMVIRESTRETAWREEVFEAGTAFLVVSSYFHRDSSRLPYADAFEPEVWLDGRAEAEPGIVPFSYGPAGCAARDLVPLTVSLFLRALLRGRNLTRVDAGGPLPASGLPASLNHFALRFSL
ncbi:Cytochrome P450 [Nocardiopsis dassonvillei]|uniref:Cytochrome P450 monooxygenase n=1 Tax=Nocardiopsis dassonvillei (strain ATCC 23218 / DSM 43111 / CIP 107115 / JCM 7437 / KCTC 9190 / NBRC 14626 / NCTC 10488 / NRRL B-5397 / IMRU 509) TaxID=446468 RepID=D7B2U4_NOCDD|nr:cytochrome P450 monooxygenase [Nocardiopsis dassonvillei subsp. dassonvillei DSM 43111]VEI86441.1 Cytochrome P450 [Nocardiopsis dassonvillei]